MICTLNETARHYYVGRTVVFLLPELYV